MKKFFSPLMAILSIVSPICIVGIMCMIETEINEAVISGLVLGCMVGSVFSIIFWVTNKYKNKILRIISLIPLVFVPVLPIHLWQGAVSIRILIGMNWIFLISVSFLRLIA